MGVDSRPTTQAPPILDFMYFYVDMDQKRFRMMTLCSFGGSQGKILKRYAQIQILVASTENK
jgi:hypothetical protein